VCIGAECQTSPPSITSRYLDTSKSRRVGRAKHKPLQMHEMHEYHSACHDAQGELVVAGVFVRVYNQQPAFAMGHEEATQLCKGLVTWINAHSKSPDFCVVPASTGVPFLSPPGVGYGSRVPAQRCQTFTCAAKTVLRFRHRS